MPRSQAKCEHLKAFGEKYLGDESWTMDGVGEGSEKELLQVPPTCLDTCQR